MAVLSRMSNTLKAGKLSARTRPLRSRMRPRGAMIGRLRMRLRSAWPRYRRCCPISIRQYPVSSTRKVTATRHWRAVIFQAGKRSSSRDCNCMRDAPTGARQPFDAARGAKPSSGHSRALQTHSCAGGSVASNLYSLKKIARPPDKNKAARGRGVGCSDLTAVAARVEYFPQPGRHAVSRLSASVSLRRFCHRHRSKLDLRRPLGYG